MATTDLVEIYVENNDTTHFVREGSTLNDLMTSSGIKMSSDIIAAYVNNQIKELSTRIFSAQSVRFVEFVSPEGRRVYSRSLFFMIEKAVQDLYGKVRVRMMHPVGKGFYCEFIGFEKVTDEHLQAIKNRMLEIVAADMPIVRNKLKLDQAIAYCAEHDLQDKLLLLETRPHYFVSFFNLGGLYDYLHGAMVPSTRYLSVFDVEQFCDGVVVLLPDRNNPNEVEKFCLQTKLYSVFRDFNYWGDVQGVANIGALNSRVLENKDGDLIKVAEALHEKHFSGIADQINKLHNEGGAKLILIAGPSSSGKTSSAKRLGVQLQVLGLHPFSISLDDYFVDRNRTPKDRDGNYDYEALEAVDVEAFNEDLNKLFAGQEVQMRKYDFITGTQEFIDKKIRLNERSVLIIEGIHGLNPMLVPHIDTKLIFKMYASALTTLSVDCGVAIHTTDNRLLRRIVRDYKYRGRDAYTTIAGWNSVRAGEDKYIFPYQEQADVMFNTALIYELAVLAPVARPLLRRVPENRPEYAEALRLLRFLEYFVEINETKVPPNSILREFIGGSSFEY